MPSADRIKTAHSAHHGPTIEYRSPGCAASGAQVTVNDVRDLSPSVHQPVPQVRRQKCRPHINALQLVRPEPRELQRASLRRPHRAPGHDNKRLPGNGVACRYRPISWYAVPAYVKKFPPHRSVRRARRAGPVLPAVLGPGLVPQSPPTRCPPRATPRKRRPPPGAATRALRSGSAPLRVDAREAVSDAAWGSRLRS